MLTHFLFPTYHHVSNTGRENLQTYTAKRSQQFFSPRVDKI